MRKRTLVHPEYHAYGVIIQVYNAVHDIKSAFHVKSLVYMESHYDNKVGSSYKHTKGGE